MPKTLSHITMAGGETVDGVDVSTLGAGGLTKDLWFALAGTYASATTFTFEGTQADAYKVERSLLTCTDSAGTTRRVGYVRSASYATNTVTCTVTTDTDLASSDKDFKIAPHRKAEDYLHLVSVPGEVVADASNPQGLWKLDLKRDSYLLPVDSAVRTAAAGSGAACTWNIYANTSALFSSAQAMGTAAALSNCRPTTKAIGAGSSVTSRLTASAGATNKASDIQIQLYIVPQKVFEAF